MSHVFTGLTSKTFSRGTLTLIRHTNACRVRPLSVSHHRLAKSEQAEDVQVNNGPIRFSTSKASHKTWKVERSMGSQYQRPWWKVLPISVMGIGFLLWCAMREESDIDTQLEKELYQHLPGLLAEQENEKK